MSSLNRKIIQNSAILLLFFIGIINLLLALPFHIENGFMYRYSSKLDPIPTTIPHTLSFVLGVVILLIVYKLYRRIRFAWVMEIIVLSASIVLHIIQTHRLTLPIVLIEVIVLLILLVSHKDFNRIADRMTFKSALRFVGISFFLAVTNATLGLLLLRTHIQNIDTLTDAFENSMLLLFLMDTSVLQITGRYGKIYADSLIGLNWICIGASVFLLLKPLIYNQAIEQLEKEKVRKLVMETGQNPMAYLALESDKRYYFSELVQGVCAYQVVSNVFVVCGDMICKPEDGFVFLNEIMSMCRQNGYKILFLNITDTFRDLYTLAGFGQIKYGEDACFQLENYNLKGGKVAKVRAAINHATKAGMVVLEYKPYVGRNSEIEKQFYAISNEWLAGKQSDEMGFMLGGMGLEDPLDRRYFYCVDPDGIIQGLVVFLPYLQRKAYLADVTRRRTKAPQGVLEKIIYEGFMQFKEEGAEWGNMGLSPLYNIAEGDHTTITEKLFNFIYENMDQGYDFKALHHAKEKYAPTHWIPRYIAYDATVFLPVYAYAIVRVQINKGLIKMAFSELLKKEGKADGAETD